MPASMTSSPPATDVPRHCPYPHLAPFNQGTLDVGHGHSIYFEEAGNPNGIPAVLLHGGPGAGANAAMSRFHDPGVYRIVLFDQRGCGRSTPHASIQNNTTWDLVADIERLRRHLGISRWQVFGGSWGSTLALAYAETHPDRVTSLILRGVFLLRRSELDWFYKDGCDWLFPDAHAEFLSILSTEERRDPIPAYYRRLTGDDENARRLAARTWGVWEGTTVSLLPHRERLSIFDNDAFALAFALIESHYFVNAGFFTSDGQLLADAHRIADIPGTIVHGRYDVITPLKNAWDLKQAWPRANLRIVADAGHAMTEPGIIHELIEATRAHAAYT